MKKTLDVYLYNKLVGKLSQDIHGQMTFVYTEEWLSNPSSIPLSYSLPLQKEIFRQKQCRPYFAGVLPEENKRTIIAKNLGISDKNDFALLKEIGGECAGAVTLIPVGESLDDVESSYQPLTNQELANIIRKLPTRPLMAGNDGIRLSLAGAQDKLAIHYENGKFSIPLNGAMSTHILKPANNRFEGLVFNEALCLKLAAMIGLPAAKVEAASVEGMDYLLVERFDRKVDESGKKVRLHQEDFCQALGIVSEMKYESEGGPNLKACFDLIRKISTRPVVDLQHLLDAVIFNFLVGNNDAHGKNFSILYDDGSIGLTPLYDIVSTEFYKELNNKMAMRIGGEYIAEKILPRHFEKLAEDAGFAKPRVKERVLDVANKVMLSVEKIEIDNDIVREIIAMIKIRCERISGLL